MINKLRRMFNQNKEILLRVVTIIVAGFVGLQLINYIAKVQNEKSRQQLQNFANATNSTYNKDYEITSGKRKDTYTYNHEKDVIETFFNACNQQKFEQAYDMLTDNCKELMYPDLDTFIKQYCQNVFYTERDYSIQAWSSNTYRVKITEDLLTTGGTLDGNYIEDYYTVVDSKLNINSLINTYKYVKNVEKANVIVSLNQVDVYMDHLDLTVSIFNERENSIMLNTMDYSDNVYLLDNSDSKFVAWLHEIPEDGYIIAPNKNKRITIKFDVPCSNAGNIVSFNMDNVISNYEQYQELGDARIIQFKMDMAD